MASGSDEPIFVGIDFGTTFSSVSFAVGYNKWPEIISKWPGIGKDSTERQLKVPTSLLRIDASSDLWGYQIPTETAPFQWFKLGLPHPEQLPQDVTNSAEYRHAESMRQREPAVSSRQVAARYLRKLWECAMEEVSAKLRLSLTGLRMRPMLVVMGIPAIWSADALVRLQDAAQEAGIPNNHPSSMLKFIAEPEAAAMSLLHQPMARSTVKVGETLLICDCGGGTTDATTYEVVSLDPPTLKECIPGGSTFCGPILMDGQFMALLKARIQARTTPMTFEHISEQVFRRIAYNLWHSSIKPDYQGSEEGVWSTELPLSCVNPKDRRAALHVEAPTLEISSDEVSAIFLPTMEKILNLVGSQYQSLVGKTGQAPQHIILCGGFGGNEYVRQRLTSLVPDILVPSPQERLTAVAVGACLRAQEIGRAGGTAPRIQIQSRVARESYAFCAGDAVRQFITKGDSISIGPSYRVPLQQQDLTFRNPGCPRVIIFRYPGQVASWGSGRKTCEISWSDPGLSYLPSPRCRIEVGVNCLGVATEFELYVNGQLQREGVQVEYV